MKLRKVKTVSNGTRHQIILKKNLLSRFGRMYKNLVYYRNRSHGRSKNSGNITVWHKGGGNKILYRDLGTNKCDINGIILSVMYDPNRNSLISNCFDLNNKIFFNTLQTNNTYPGTLIQVKKDLKTFKLGFRTKMMNIPTGTIINSISNDNGIDKIKYAKSAGTHAQIIQKLDNNIVKVRLPSNTIIKIDSRSNCSIGACANSQSNRVNIGKAGKNRKKNIRPTVRGIAMNPVDHPHGGRTNGGRPSVTPWGLPTKSKFYLRKKKI